MESVEVWEGVIRTLSVRRRESGQGIGGDQSPLYFELHGLSFSVRNSSLRWAYNWRRLCMALVGGQYVVSIVSSSYSSRSMDWTRSSGTLEIAYGASAGRT